MSSFHPREKVKGEIFRRIKDKKNVGKKDVKINNPIIKDKHLKFYKEITIMGAL